MLHALWRLHPAGNGLLLFRLPSMLALYGAAVCVFLLLRRSVSPFAALAGFAITLDSGLFWFAVQARMYAAYGFNAQPQAAFLAHTSFFYEVTRDYSTIDMTTYFLVQAHAIDGRVAYRAGVSIWSCHGTGGAKQGLK
jgi:hypothetical protein